MIKEAILTEARNRAVPEMCPSAHGMRIAEWMRTRHDADDRLYYMKVDLCRPMWICDPSERVLGVVGFVA
jgi:hypothetical protein